MSAILSVLQHRATVERSVSTLHDGSPTTAWGVVAVRVPVLYSKDQAELDPTWDAEQRKEANQRGTLFAAAGANIRPGDRLRITRPPGLGLTLAVLSDPSTVLDQHQVHHREYSVRSVAA